MDTPDLTPDTTPEIQTPMKVRITLENLNGEDGGQVIYNDFIFYSKDDFAKDWNEHIQDKLEVLFNIENSLPF